MIGHGRAVSNVREIRTDAYFPKQHRSIENVIPRCAATFAPFPFEIGSRIISADLLCVTIIAAIRGINATAALRHSGSRRRVHIGSVLLHLRIEMTDLQIRNENQTSPRERERSENSEK